MFESNFPVDKVSCSYGVMFNAFKRIASALQLSPTERNDIFYGTAARAYSLPLSEELNAGISAPAIAGPHVGTYAVRSVAGGPEAKL